MTDPLSTISTRTTPQTERADRAQERNRAGGYTFVPDDLARLRRFLAMGVEGGTFYAGEKEVAVESSTLVLNLVETKPADVLATVLDMSERGANVRQQPVMWTMAALAGSKDPEVRKAALDALPRIARTGSHLFLFASYVENFRGWGKGLRKAVARWYDDKDVDGLAYQIEKYRSRYGFTHRDMLLLGHVGSRQTLGLSKADPIEMAYGEDAATRLALYAHAAGKDVNVLTLPESSRVASALAKAATEDDVVEVIGTSKRVSWEMVPSQWLGKSRVWEALLDTGNVPIGALLRNLARLTANGTLDPFGQDDRTARIIGRLRDPETLAKGRVHPMAVLLAAATYAAGRSQRGDSTWSPIPNINKALDAGFYAAFGSIEPDESKSVVLGLDVSGSMNGGSVGGLPLVPRDAATALALALGAQFPKHVGMAFTSKPGSNFWRNPDATTLTAVDFDRGRRVTDVVRETSQMQMGGTDCSLPVLWAMEKGLHVDAFVILTDNETWAGKMHPHQALRQYRERTGVPARMVTVAMVNNASTIADPSDPLMLDVVGLDSNVVSLVSDFIAGRV